MQDKRETRAAEAPRMRPVDPKELGTVEGGFHMVPVEASGEGASGDLMTPGGGTRFHVGGGGGAGFHVGGGGGSG